MAALGPTPARPSCGESTSRGALGVARVVWRSGGVAHGSISLGVQLKLAGAALGFAAFMISATIAAFKLGLSRSVVIVLGSVSGVAPVVALLVLRRTHLAFGGGVLECDHRPALSARVQLAAGDIKSIVCSTGSRVVDDEDSTTYTVEARLLSGGARKIVAFEEPAAAFLLARKVRELLGMDDLPILPDGAAVLGSVATDEGEPSRLPATLEDAPAGAAKKLPTIRIRPKRAKFATCPRCGATRDRRDVAAFGPFALCECHALFDPKSGRERRGQSGPGPELRGQPRGLTIERVENEGTANYRQGSGGRRPVHSLTMSWALDDPKLKVWWGVATMVPSLVSFQVAYALLREGPSLTATGYVVVGVAALLLLPGLRIIYLAGKGRRSLRLADGKLKLTHNVAGLATTEVESARIRSLYTYCDVTQVGDRAKPSSFSVRARLDDDSEHDIVSRVESADTAMFITMTLRDALCLVDRPSTTKAARP